MTFLARWISPYSEKAGRFSSLGNSFPLLIHAFQLTTVINTLSTIPTMILIVEVVREIIKAQRTVFGSCKTLPILLIQKSTKYQLTVIWLIFQPFTVCKKHMNTTLEDLFLVLFRMMCILEMFLMNHPTTVNVSQFLVRSNCL